MPPPLLLREKQKQGSAALSRGLVGLVGAFSVHRGSAGAGLAGRGKADSHKWERRGCRFFAHPDFPSASRPTSDTRPPPAGAASTARPGRRAGAGVGEGSAGGHGWVPADGRQEPPPSPTAGGPPFRGFSRRGWPSPRFPSLPSLRGHVSPFLFAVETISRSRARTEADRCPSGARGGRGAGGPHAGGGAPCAGTPAAPPGLGLRRRRAMPGSVR